MWPNDVRSRVVQNVWIGHNDERGEDEATEDATSEGSEYGQQRTPASTPLTDERDQRTGIQKPQQDSVTPVTILEQMCWIDMDGDDYEEPYFVTVELETGFVRRIVARFSVSGVKRKKNVIMAIEPEQAYVKYGFIPAPDGSCYDIGFGHLLGPISDSVDTAINQIFDGGTMATLGGGFLGRGARLKGGKQSFKPYEWKEVDGAGDDLRKNIVPLEIREPSQVLLELLKFLIAYGERIISANDVQVGENPGQNTPAESMRTMNQNGQRIFSAIFKRTWRSMRDEFRLQFDLNTTYLDHDADYEVISSTNGMVTVNDYRQPAQSVRPQADPNVTSEEDRRRKAAMTMQMSMSVPGFNRYKSIHRYLVAERVPAIDEVFPPLGNDPQTGKPMTDIPNPPQPQILLAQARLALAQARVQEVNQKAQEAMQKLRQAAVSLQQQAQLINGQVTELRARAVMELSQAKGVDQGHQIALIDSMIGAMKNHQESLMEYAKLLSDQANAVQTTAQQPMEGGTQSGGVQGTAPEAALGGMAGFGNDAGVFTQIKNPAPIPAGQMGQG
jgi:chaperonin GroES